MEYRDYYQTLGVPRTAAKADIKKAFRKLARQHHPDVNKGDAAAERRFKEVSEANEVLSDPKKRELYDQIGPDWASYQQAGSPAGARSSTGGRRGTASADPFAGFGGFGGQPGGGQRFEFQGSAEDLEGFSDFFRTVFGGGMGGASGASRRPTATGTRTRSGAMSIEDLLAGMGGTVAGGGPAGAAPRAIRGQDAEAEVEIGLEEAFHGTELHVEVGGRRLAVKIPRGVDTGRRIRLSGKAGSEPNAGDLYLRVKVRPHPIFTRTGNDLRRDLALTLGDALLGAEVPVTTLKGKVLLNIPAGTQNGRTFRLKGQGMPHFKADPGSTAAGDLMVTVKVNLPTKLDEDATEAARRFLELVDQKRPD